MTTRGELMNVIARLELMSHAPAMNLQPSARSTGEGDDRGGNRPPGGIDRKADTNPEFLLKSADHFRQRLSKARTEYALRCILDDARKTLEAWQHTPSTDDPEVAGIHWRWMVAISLESDAEIARRYSVSRAYVAKIRRQYGNTA